jgi:cell division protein FtsN
MTDYDRDRGAYAPSGEAPLAFDPRNPTGRGAGRPPTTLIVSAGVLIVVVLALVFYYRSGVRHTGEPPVVGQPLSDIKQAPPASSQPTDAAAGLSIYSAEQGQQAANPSPTFEAPPEQPRPRPTAPVAAAPLAAASAPAASPAPQRQILALAPAPSTPAPAVTAVAAGAGLLVQIGAFSSPALADKGWNDVARLLPGQMVGRTKRVEPVSQDPGTLYRAYVGGFGTKAEASSFCADLKSAGHACLVK